MKRGDKLHAATKKPEIEAQPEINITRSSSQYCNSTAGNCDN